MTAMPFFDAKAAKPAFFTELHDLHEGRLSLDQGSAGRSSANCMQVVRGGLEFPV